MVFNAPQFLLQRGDISGGNVRLVDGRVEVAVAAPLYTEGDVNIKGVGMCKLSLHDHGIATLASQVEGGNDGLVAFHQLIVKFAGLWRNGRKQFYAFLLKQCL